MHAVFMLQIEFRLKFIFVDALVRPPLVVEAFIGPAPTGWNNHTVLKSPRVELRRAGTFPSTRNLLPHSSWQFRQRLVGCIALPSSHPDDDSLDHRNIGVHDLSGETNKEATEIGAWWKAEFRSKTPDWA